MTNQVLSPIKKSLKLIAVAVFNWGQKMGEPTQLATTNKTSLVAAINELHARPMHDGTVDSEQINQLIEQKLATITNGASAAFDTLKEIEDYLTKGSNATQGILQEIANLKSKVTACEQDVTLLKQYIGFETDDQLEPLITQALTTGA